MSIQLYMDEHVPSAITAGLRRRGVDVLTAQEDGMEGTDDPDLLDRALRLGRVVFSRDDDFLREAARRQSLGQAFAGVIYAHQLRVSVSQCITDLELIALAAEPGEFVNRVQFLPLK